MLERDLYKQLNIRRAGLAVLVSIALALVVSSGNAGLNEELVLLTWADYLDPEIVAEFEQEHGVNIRFAYYESDDARDEILAASDGRNFDLAMVNGLMLQSYAKRSWLAPVAENDIPNLTHIETRWRNAFPSSERYAVPYFWGTLGIAYRQDLFPEGFPSWKDFFQPAEKLRGKIAMLKSSRDITGMALKSLGHSANTNDRDEIREAARLLQAQRPFVRSYEYVSLTEESALVTGDVWATLAYSGDALMVSEHHQDIAYVVPEEGGNLWVDYLTILQSSPRKALAAQFIDFLNRPEIAARNAEFVYYATPNIAARQYVSDDYAEDPVIHPSADVIARSEVYRELEPRARKTVNSLVSQLLN